MNKILLLIIGIPGAGKSTVAANTKKNNPDFANANIWEADMYFIDNNGNYNWDFNKLGAAHNWCKANVKLDMLSGKNVIVSNTNLTPKERKPYLDLAKEFGYTVEVITCNGGFQNIHGVSEESLERMRKRFIPFSENELL
jgi:predicted kinase